MRMLIVLGSLTMIMAFCFADSHADNWQTPCVLTKTQEATLASLTGLQVSSVAAEIVACRIYGSDVLLVRYTDGRLGTFGIGERQDIDTSFHQKEGNPEQKIVAEHLGTEQEHKLFVELRQIWFDAPQKNLASDILAKSDTLVQEIFMTTQPYEIKLATYELLGTLGNRYLPVIQRIPSLPYGATIVYYGAYISLLGDDSPSDQQKNVAMEKLVGIFETTDLNTKFNLSFQISQEIKRVNPNAYEKLHQLMVIIENPS